MPHISKNRAWAIGSLYVASAMLPELATVLAGSGPINWPLAVVKMLIPGAITARTYLDGTIETMRQQREAKPRTGKQRPKHLPSNKPKASASHGAE